MRRLMVLAAIVAVGAACAPPPTGGGGGGGSSTIAAGCYVSATSDFSLIYEGPIETYKNAQLADSVSPCGGDPLDEWVTVVIATDEADALATCQAGADPAADAAGSLAAAGFDTLPDDAWYCENPFSGALFQVGQCRAIGTASVQFLGPRDTLNNVELYSDTTCSTPADPPSLWTHVQHGNQTWAHALCLTLDPTFTGANTLAGLPFVPAMPGDAYLCVPA